MYKETLSAFIGKNPAIQQSLSADKALVFLSYRQFGCVHVISIGLSLKKLKRLTDWFTREDPAEEYLFYFKRISVSCAAIIEKVLKAEESAWFYKMWSKAKLSKVQVVQQVLSTCLVLLSIRLIHSEEQILFNYLTCTLLFCPIRSIGFSVKEGSGVTFL